MGAEHDSAVWVYLASSTQTDLASTLGSVLEDQLLWRPSTNSLGALIANVGNLQVGDSLILAWRDDRKAYLRCRIATALRPTVVNGRALVIDQIGNSEGNALASRGYGDGRERTFEAIRFDRIDECYFPLRGRYGGNNALHRIDARDREAVASATSVPAVAWGRRARASSVARSTAVRQQPPPSRPLSRTPQSKCTVDRLRIAGGAAERAFDAYVMVDWSSSAKPNTGNDSIWIAAGSWTSEGFSAGAPENHSTRIEAVKRIAAFADSWRNEGLRVLVGMDFAFGYPAGFAKALGLDSTIEPWRAVHEHISNNVIDNAENQHNRDGFADACNQAIEPKGPGPFWACRRKAVTPHLTQQRLGVFDFPYAGALAEWRLTERRAAERTVTQSVWKLNCGVSVGGQTILGIKHLHEMATALGARRWPFDTGWTRPPAGQGAVWFAEIFPSLVHYPEWDNEYAKRRDRTQVQSCVRRAAEEDREGRLSKRFAEPTGLSVDQKRRVVSEEGWILWV